MTILDAILQGIVQGLTEFLPVSSSGHLSLVQHFTGISGETGAVFSVMLHLGTLLAVFIAFWRTIWSLIVEAFAVLGDLFRGRFTLKNLSPERRMLFLLVVSLVPLVAVVALKDFYASFSADNSILVEGLCFLLTSVLLFLSDKCVPGHKTAKEMRYGDALLIGGMQAIAPLPGLSRSGSTISAGIFLGLSREFAIAFSFIMGVPAVLGANLLEIGPIMQEGLGVPVSVLLVGVLVSLVFGLLAIKMVKWLAATNRFKIFAWYTLILGTVVVIIALYEAVSGYAIRFV